MGICICYSRSTGNKHLLIITLLITKHHHQEFWKYGNNATDKKKVNVDTSIVAGGSDSTKNISVVMKVS